jgi:YfiH family protein
MYISSNKPLTMEFASLSSMASITHGTILRPEEGTCKDLAYHFLQRQGLTLCFARQVHCDVVAVARPGISLEPCDALMTNKEGLCLCLSHADCQIILFFDPIQKVIAAAHSGWRGSVHNIIGKTTDAMQQQYGTDPKDLYACVSPSLGPCHAEFIHYKQELPEEFWPFGDKRCHFDFWQIAKQQLTHAGVKEEKIEVAGLCTFDNPRQFFSYRRDKTQGRNITYIALQNSRCIDA